MKRNAWLGLLVLACLSVYATETASGDQASKASETRAEREKSFAKYLQIPGATRVGSDACTTCHADVAGNFRHAFHAQQGVECEDCHGAGSLHVGSSDYGQIIKLRGKSAEAANGVCLSCHAQDEKIRNWMAGSHSSNEVRCTDCHQIHGREPRAAIEPRVAFDTSTPGHVTAVEALVPESKAKFEPRWRSSEDCLRCHQEQRGELNLPYHHPLREGKLACVDCHDPHGGPAGNNLQTTTANELCLSCHAQYRGPFMYQHPPVTENCLTCHTPHGSPNTNLLTISLPALCYQCHAGHHNGSSLPLADRCTDCHGSIHGSDVPSATGGSVFIDKGPFGVPKEPSVAAVAGSSQKLAASHPGGVFPAMGAAGGPIAAALPGLLAQMYAGQAQVNDAAGSAAPDSFAAFSVTPGGYRFVNTTGFGGRVGEYDSLQQSEGGDVETAYVSVSRRLSILSRANILSGDDYHLTSDLSAGERLRIGFEIRSFLQQQDNYPFYSDVISPDIVADRLTPSGTVFGVKRRFGKANARLKVPSLPVHLFVKGDWQARVGTTQLAWYDMGGQVSPTPDCAFCHFTSQFQPVNYTTRNVGGGAEAKLGPVQLMWQHDFSSFSDRLQFPSGLFGPTFGPDLPNGVQATNAGTYFLDVPAPNQSSEDTARVSWAASSRLLLNSQVTYTRGRDLFTRNQQNAFDSYTTLNWRALDRLRFTANYGQHNLLNDFTPFYSSFGDVSYHQHRAGLQMQYELAKHLEVETHYERKGISRSNSFLWPQFYSPHNTDLLLVVPASFSNTTGLALRYRPGERWSLHAGYDWTGTHAPGYLTEPKSNNRILAGLTLSPFNRLVFTNDFSSIIQNAVPIIQRRNRFCAETAVASLSLLHDWNLGLGYSYQQSNLSTYMAIQNDPGAGYVLQEPFVPYKQLSQTYWAESASRFFKQRVGLNARYTYNSARSGMRPDLNPADAELLGSASLIQQNCAPAGQPFQSCFDPALFAEALVVSPGALQLGATKISQVIIPESIGQAKLYYLLPHQFNAGVIFYYGSYRDELNPNLNGVLRTFNIYIGRSW